MSNRPKASANAVETSTARVVAASCAAISLREAGRRLSVNLHAIQKRIRAGTLTTLPNGKLDWATAQREWTQNRDESKVREKLFSIQDGRNFLAAKTRREYVRLEREALELKRIKGELASIGEVNAFVAGMILRAREVLTRIAPELKDRLAQETNPHECQRLLDSEVERALGELQLYGQTTAHHQEKGA